MAAIQAPHHAYAEPRDGDVCHQPPASANLKGHYLGQALIEAINKASNAEMHAAREAGAGEPAPPTWQPGVPVYQHEVSVKPSAGLHAASAKRAPQDEEGEDEEEEDGEESPRSHGARGSASPDSDTTETASALAILSDASGPAALAHSVVSRENPGCMAPQEPAPRRTRKGFSRASAACRACSVRKLRCRVNSHPYWCDNCISRGIMCEPQPNRKRSRSAHQFQYMAPPSFLPGALPGAIGTLPGVVSTHASATLSVDGVSPVNYPGMAIASGPFNGASINSMNPFHMAGTSGIPPTPTYYTTYAPGYYPTAPVPTGAAASAAGVGQASGATSLSASHPPPHAPPYALPIGGAQSQLPSAQAHIQPPVHLAAPPPQYDGYQCAPCAPPTYPAPTPTTVSIGLPQPYPTSYASSPPAPLARVTSGGGPSLPPHGMKYCVHNGPSCGFVPEFSRFCPSCGMDQQTRAH